MRHPPERPLVIVRDTREPAVEASDREEAIFRPRVYAPGIPRGTPFADWPRVEVATVRAKLDVGDYSLPGLETLVAFERKSGPDLLATLFGAVEDSVGQRHATLERFRAELARARSLALFVIVCEESQEWLWYEADRRYRRYGKSFEPPAVLALLRSFLLAYGVPTLWSGGAPRAGGGWASGKADAELEVGSTLASVWSQATGGEKSRSMRKRGESAPWLDRLVEQAAAVA